MKISMIGLNKVALTNGISLENMGNEVLYILENDSSFIDNVNYLLSKGINAVRSPKEALEQTNMCFISEGLDSNNEEIAIQKVIQNAKVVGENMSRHMFVIDRMGLSSDKLHTVKDTVQEALNERHSNLTFEVISNSSFLR
ncbi:MAG: hypothetical protein KN64_11780 [Sulfurovum sp. AS07-7]|nr:MAG: hypothetical protein KN64_11780 [Sulfurovum sp. AS07-7]